MPMKCTSNIAVAHFVLSLITEGEVNIWNSLLDDMEFSSLSGYTRQINIWIIFRV